MKLTKSIIPLAVSAALGLGMASEASASVYAVSTLEIDNLSVAILNSDNTPNTTNVVRNFTYTLTNTAFLNGNGGATNDTCGGTPASHDCGVIPPAANAIVYNAPGSTVVAADDSYGLQGPGADQYSRADSVVYTSQLTGDPTTHQQQIAESELQGGTSASANSTIQSITGFTFDFTVGAEGKLFLDFDASAYLEAFSNDPGGVNQSAQANIAVLGRLSAADGSGFWQWNPNGTVDTNCLTGGALASCTEIADGGIIGNNSVGITTDPDSEIYTTGGFDDYTVLFSGLSAGDYTFTLRSETSTQLSRTDIPEPAVNLLLGSSLIALSLGARRRKKHSMAA